MARNHSYIKGYSLFELLLLLSLTQVICFYSWPSIQHIYQYVSIKKHLNSLSVAIEWSRWQAVIRQEEISLVALNHDWAKAWQIKTKKQVLRQYPGYEGLNWQGFQNTSLVFYPDMARNHVNGYFQIHNYRLYLNRFGQTRFTHGL